jgi:hypothetical protein
LPQSEAPLMGRVAPRANLHSVRLSWVAADIRPIRDSRRRLAASNNRERKKSLRTLQGQFRLPRLSGNYHRVRCSAQMDSRANTCVAPQVDQFISRAGWRTGSASPRRARRQRVAVVRYTPREPNAGGHRVEAAGIALSVGPDDRLAQDEKPGRAGGEAGIRRGLGSMTLGVALQHQIHCFCCCRDPGQGC